jgi:hypothetical protein
MENVSVMIKNFLFCLIILLPSLSFGQEMDEEAFQQKKLKQHMIQQIYKIKEGVLLVRLQTRQNSIQSLKQGNMPKMAARVEQEQKEYNKLIIAAFRKNFNFCPVYFFNSIYSDAVLAKQFNSVVFFNDSLLPDSSIKPKTDKFLAAEFGTMQQDTTTYVEGSYIYHGANGPERKTRYRGGNNTQISSLIIMSEQLVQLSAPFPYYERVFETLPDAKKLSNTVIKMNDKLNAFYNSRK